MPVKNYKMLFEQDAKSVVTLEGFACSIFAMIEAAEEMAENSPYSYCLKLDVLHAIRAACEEILEQHILEMPEMQVAGEQGEARRHVAS